MHKIIIIWWGFFKFQMKEYVRIPKPALAFVWLYHSPLFSRVYVQLINSTNKPVTVCPVKVCCVAISLISILCLTSVIWLTTIYWSTSTKSDKSYFENNVRNTDNLIMFQLYFTCELSVWSFNSGCMFGLGKHNINFVKSAFRLFPCPTLPSLRQSEQTV